MTLRARAMEPVRCLTPLPEPGPSLSTICSPLGRFGQSSDQVPLEPARTCPGSELPVPVRRIHSQTFIVFVNGDVLTPVATNDRLLLACRLVMRRRWSLALPGGRLPVALDELCGASALLAVQLALWRRVGRPSGGPGRPTHRRGVPAPLGGGDGTA